MRNKIIMHWLMHKCVYCDAIMQFNPYCGYIMCRIVCFECQKGINRRGKKAYIQHIRRNR